MNDPLRVGLLLDSPTVEAWLYSTIQQILGVPGCQVCLVVWNGAPTVGRSFLRRLKNINSTAFAAYARLDRKLFGSRLKNDAFARRDASDLLAGIEQITVIPKQTKFVDRFENADLDKIRARGLDVLIRFGFRIIKGEILKAARHGVWSLHHGDNDFYHGGPALFWEIYENNPVSGTILQLLTEGLDAGKVLYKSWAATEPYSLLRNRNDVYWKTATFIPRKLRELATSGTAALVQIPPADDANPKFYRMPTLVQMAKFSIRIGARFAATQARSRFCFEQWFVAVAPVVGPGDPVPHHGEFKVIASPPCRFYADPCVVSHGARDWIFFEDFSFRSKIGRIACVAVVEDGAITEPTVVLEEKFHLSYPFVFEDDGTFFMIPETAVDQTIRLYRATAFPNKWVLDRVLLEGVRAVDATLHRENGLYWMFVNIACPGSQSSQDELHVFYSASVYGPWKPHRLNPVVSDVRRARPAGRLFRSGSQLYRPSQDSAGAYGNRLVLNAIDSLTPGDFREREVASLGPERLVDSQCLHSLSFSDRLLAVDGKRSVWKWGGKFKVHPLGSVQIVSATCPRSIVPSTRP